MTPHPAPAVRLSRFHDGMLHRLGPADSRTSVRVGDFCRPRRGAALAYPPETGGRKATSSPSATGVWSRA